MARFNLIQHDFSAGELSPKVKGKVDLKEYFKGCETLNNYLVGLMGNAIKRPGFRYIREISSLGDDPALIPFVYDREESYVIAIKNNGTTSGYLNIYRNDGAGTTSSLTWQTPLEAPASSLDPRGYRFAQSNDALFVCHISGTVRPFVILRTAQDTFTVTDYLALVGYPITVWKNAVLATPYREINISTTTITPSATSGSITLTASAGLFDANMVNTIFKLDHSGTVGAARITSFTSSTVVNATVLVNFGATTATDIWQEASWSKYRGYPKAVAIYQQRLVWGGNISEPERLWFSMTQNFFHMAQRRDFSSFYTGTTLDTDPFGATIAGNNINSIQWLQSGDHLKVGTLGAEYILDYVDYPGLTDESKRIRVQTEYGSADKNAVSMSHFSFYVSRDGRRLRSFRFNNDNGSYISDNMNVVADHIPSHGYNGAAADEYAGIDIDFLCFHPSRNIIWAINSNKKLFGLTVSRESGFSGWHTHDIGGTSDAEITGIAVIQGDASNGDYFDTLYVVSKRTINSSTKYYLEAMMFDFEHDVLDNSSSNAGDLPFYLDGSVRKSISATNTITGLSHLEAETVTAVNLTDKVIETGTVSSGNLVLSQTYAGTTNWVVGFPYTATLKTMPVEAGMELESAQGQIKRIDRAIIKFFKTYSAKVGRDSSNLETLSFSDVYTGEKVIMFNADPDLENSVTVISDQPYPMQILSITMRGQSYGG